MVNVAWSASDDTDLARMEVQRREASTSWQNVTLAQPTALGTTFEVRFGKTVQVRVRAVDGEGNTSAWTTSPRYLLKLVNDTSAHVRLSGAWQRKYSSSALKGQFVRSRVPGESAALTITGVQFAIIGNRAPTLGQADVSLDGITVATVSASADSRAWRQILYLSPVDSTPSPTVVGLLNVSSDGFTSIELDAFLVLKIDP